MMLALVKNDSSKASPFVRPMASVRHFSTVEFLFHESLTYADARRWSVSEKLDSRAKRIVAKYPEVWQNPDYRTQAEGYEFVGENANDVRLAGEEFARYLSRFSCIVPVYQD